MPSTVRIVSGDAAFAESIRSRLECWGLSVAIECELEMVTPALVHENHVDVVLLDVRRHEDRVLRWLSSIKQIVPALEVILLNIGGEIRVSMDAMRAGASNELSAPLDTAALRSAISAALRRRNKRLGGAKLSLLERFERAMSAATFAQAGEFETAREMLDEERLPAKRRTDKPGRK